MSQNAAKNLISWHATSQALAGNLTFIRIEYKMAHGYCGATSNLCSETGLALHGPHGERIVQGDFLEEIKPA